MLVPASESGQLGADVLAVAVAALVVMRAAFVEVPVVRRMGRIVVGVLMRRMLLLMHSHVVDVMVFHAASICARAMSFWSFRIVQW